MSLINSIFSFLRFNQKNWKAVVLCMIAATVFWFLNSLNKEYTTNINFPLSFEYDHRYYIPVDKLPEEIQMNVTGIGWDLFRRSAGFKIPPLVIPLERPSDVKKIVGASLPGLFSSQLGALQINFVVADTIAIHFEPKATRWLTVRADSIVNHLRTSYGVVSDVNIKPDSVFIDGPISVVTQLREPFQLDINQDNIDSDFNEEIEVRLPQGNLIKRNPPVVQVAFEVEKFVDLSDSVLLQFLNTPPNAQLQLENNRVPATINVRESMAENFPWDSIKAVVDLTGFKKGKVKVLPDIEGLPSSVKLVKIDTLHITY